MMEMMEVRSAGIYLLDEKENELVYVTHRGFSKVFSKGMKRFKMGANITGKTALSGEPIFIEDYPNHPEALSLVIEEGVKSLAVIPLKSGMKVYGTLNIGRKESPGSTLMSETSSIPSVRSSVGPWKGPHFIPRTSNDWRRKRSSIPSVKRSPPVLNSRESSGRSLRAPSISWGPIQGPLPSGIHGNRITPSRLSIGFRRR